VGYDDRPALEDVKLDPYSDADAVLERR